MRGGKKKRMGNRRFGKEDWRKGGVGS